MDQVVTELKDQLGGFVGYRSVWMGDDGGLWHAEPEEEFDAETFRYIGTFLRPTIDELYDALALRMRPAKVSTQVGVALRDGTSSSTSPPAVLKSDLARIPISSIVSRQSATNAGQNTTSRRLPLAASS
jgi:hypothetical protein